MTNLRLKDLNSVNETTKNGGLKKTLGAFDLLLLGIGGIIGTGIFVLTGTAAQDTGPALTMSFLMSGLICMFVALVYTEIATMINTSGSVYTYSYVALGEIVAWITALMLMLNLAVGAMTVAAGWSGYVVDILKHGGINLPSLYTSVPADGGIINLPAMLIVLCVTALLIKGTKESTFINNVLVAVKIGAIFLFIIIAVPHFDVRHWQPFAPFGFDGIAIGAGGVFLAFAGFDSLAAAAEECKNPKRDITIGVIGSLAICTILYMVVAALLTGIIPFTELNNAKPLAHALKFVGSNIGSALVAAGGIAGMSTVLIVQIYALSRIFLAIARDGLLPKAISKIHPKFGTPYISTISIGVIIAVFTGLIPIKILNYLSSMGTLTVFIIASVVVVVLRFKLPNAERPFRCPAIYVTCPIAISMCLFLLSKLAKVAGLYYLIWLLLGLTIYFAYGYRNSQFCKSRI